MPEIVIKYKNNNVLKTLQDMAKLLDIETSVNSNTKKNGRTSDLPITFAKKPDIKALAGIWEGREITLEKLREDAWANRF